MVKGLGISVEGRSTLREVGNDTAWRQHGTRGRAEVQSSEESRPQPDLDSRPTSAGQP